MGRIVIVDYCDTFFKGQSMQLYIEYLYSNIKPDNIYNYFFRFLLKLPISSGNFKKFAFKGISGISKVEIEKYSLDFYENILKPRHNLIMENILLKHKNEGDKIIIASGGCIEYLKYLINDYFFDVIIGTELKYDKNSRLIGIKYPECLSEEKLSNVQKYFNSHNLNWSDSIFYTDSSTDLPLLNKVKKGVVVGYKESSPEWINEKFTYIKI